MDLQTQKLELIDKILHSTNAEQLAVVSEALNDTVAPANTIADSVLQKIYLDKISNALQDIKQGNTKTNNDLKKDMNDW